MILAIETSTPTAGLALLDEGREVVWSVDFTTDRSHNSVIFGPVEEALDLSRGKLRGIAVGLGPGSYSGVRVGIAAAQGLSLARKLPVVGVSSLAAYEAKSDSYLVVGDARRKTRFVALIRNRQLVDEPELVSEEEFPRRLEAAEWEGFPVMTPDENVVLEHERISLGRPVAAELGRQAWESLDGVRDDAILEPHYLRPPYITTPKPK